MATNKFSLSEFKNPHKKHNLMYSWVWNAPVTKEGIKEQIASFKEGGIEGIYILPEPENFRPDSMSTELKPQYLSDEYFELIRFAFETAEENGINMWLYDEGGWPSGGACGKTNEEYSDAPPKKLNRRSVIINENEKYIPSADALAAFIGKKKVTEGECLKNKAEVMEYYLLKLPALPNYVNLSDKKVTETFINNTYEKYYKAIGDKFTKDIVFFTDEPAVHSVTLSQEILSKFEKEYGYDLKNYLYIFDSDIEKTDEEKKIIISYYRLMGKIFNENFFIKLRDFCHSKNISFGGHLNGDHLADYSRASGYFSSIEALRNMDVPGIDVIWNQIKVPYGGRKIMDEGEGFFPRLASSAARQSGNRFALTESLGVYGEGLTFDEIRYILNYQAVRGINLFNLMDISYAKDGFYNLVERPVFSPQKPGYKNTKVLSDYFKRISYLLSLGERVEDNALYVPFADIMAEEKAIYENYKNLGESLERKGVNFDLIDDAGILKAEATPDGLKLGNALYKHIIVPECKFMPKEVKEKIKAYISVPEAYINVESENLRYLVRDLGDKKIYFFFNEGEAPLSEVIDVKGKITELDLTTGEAYKKDKMEVKLLCGEAAAFIVGENYETEKELKLEYIAEIEDFEFVKAEKFEITKNGIVKKEVSNKETRGVFSGNVVYKAKLILNEEITDSGKIRLELEGFASTVNIAVNGVLCAYFGMNPMYFDVPSGLFKKENELIITVSNTLADELADKEAFIRENFKVNEIGPYHERSLAIEKQSKAKLSKGTVKIAKYL